jgi:hypothetical protein
MKTKSSLLQVVQQMQLLQFLKYWMTNIKFFNAGNALATALAAPVSVITMFKVAARPRRSALWLVTLYVFLHQTYLLQS